MLVGPRPRTLDQPDTAGAAAIALLVTTAAWLELDHAIAIAIVIAAALVVARHLPVPPASAPAGPAPALTRAGLARSLPIAALVAGPTIFLLVGTLREEFPFSGDHIHHLIVGSVAQDFWVDHLTLVAGFAVLVWAMRRFGVTYWALIAFAGLVAWSFAEPAPDSAARYPASGYLLDLPLQMIARKLVWSSPLDAHRITTAASVLAWLFVLRPMALRRWPDGAIVPFALFYFWQQDVVYYDTTAYLEPWSIVFVLTAIELLASDRPSRSWLPVTLVGVAAGFKEQAVLVLPWVGLATLAFVPRTRRAWAAAAVNGLLALAPFVVWYVAVRPLTGLARQSELASWSEIASAHRARVFAWRVLEQFGWTGVALLAVSLTLIIHTAIKRPERRWLLACLCGAALTQIAFFYTDRVSIPWTGYSRFHLFGLALFGFAAWMPRADSGDRRRTTIAAILIAAAQAPTLAGTLVLAARPDPARNFFEHHDAPIYFPIKSLVTEAHAAGVLPLHAPIGLRVIPNEVYGPFEIVYPTLHYPFIGGVTDCTCGAGHENLLVRLVYPARLRRGEGDRPLPDEDRACIAQVEATFAHVFRREIDGRPTGVLGVGCRALPP